LDFIFNLAIVDKLNGSNPIQSDPTIDLTTPRVRLVKCKTTKPMWRCRFA